MSWKRLERHRIPRWVKRSRRRYLKGRTFLYKKTNGICYRKLRNEWSNPIPWWQYFLIGLISAIAATILAQIIISKFFS